MTIKYFVRNWLLPPAVNQLLIEAPAPLKRLWGGEVRPAPVQLDPVDERPASLHNLRTAPLGEIMWVPVEKIRIWGRGVTREQNQHVRYFAEGASSFRRFYELHQPENQMEEVFLRPEESGKFTPVRFPRRRTPWSFEQIFRGGLGGLNWEHGDHNRGPISEQKLLLEAKRLDDIQAAVLTRGFLKFHEDFIRFGYILIDDTDSGNLDYRVTVIGGIHRTTLLAFLGWPVIPMIAAPTFPLREVRLGQVTEWPGVLDGTFSLQAARAYFLAHFRDPHEVLIPEW